MVSLGTASRPPSPTRLWIGTRWANGGLSSGSRSGCGCTRTPRGGTGPGKILPQINRRKVSSRTPPPGAFCRQQMPPEHEGDGKVPSTPDVQPLEHYLEPEAARLLRL